MSDNLVDFHHYKGNDLTPAEKVERRIAELLINSDVLDEQRESSIIFELKHSSNCCQLAKLIAEKRNLDLTISEVACLLHDIYVALKGKSQNHAVLGAPLAKQLLEEVGGFSEIQVETICNAIAHHSEKEIYSDDPYAELVKDVDVLDCSLYRGAENYYRLHKPGPIYDEYVKRIVAVRKELGLAEEPIFRPND